MPLAERAALGVLARQADRRPLDQQRCEGERFGMRPFDAAPPAVGSFERVATPLQLLLKLGMDREAVRYREQLAVQLGQHIHGDRGRWLGRRLPRDAMRVFSAW